MCVVVVVVVSEDDDEEEVAGPAEQIADPLLALLAAAKDAAPAEPQPPAPKRTRMAICFNLYLTKVSLIYI